jgi:glycine/D-amino acid oxidase-like deaminating enzyme
MSLNAFAQRVIVSIIDMIHRSVTVCWRDGSASSEIVKPPRRNFSWSPDELECLRQMVESSADQVDLLKAFDGVLDFYIRPEQAPDSCLMGMSIHNEADTFEDVHDLSKEPPGVSQSMGFQVWEKVMTRFPFLEQAHLKWGYTGIADMTPDNQALLGYLPVNGLFVAAGMSGIGQLMASLIADEAEAASILRPLRPTRADEGQLLLPQNRLSTIA